MIAIDSDGAEETCFRMNSVLVAYPPKCSLNKSANYHHQTTALIVVHRLVYLMAGLHGCSNLN